MNQKKKKKKGIISPLDSESDALNGLNQIALFSCPDLTSVELSVTNKDLIMN